MTKKAETRKVEVTKTRARARFGSLSTAKAPAAIVVATETFHGTLDDGQEVMVYANATTAKPSDPVVKKWPALFKPLA
jgi:hypothetical protein